MQRASTGSHEVRSMGSLLPAGSQLQGYCRALCQGADWPQMKNELQRPLDWDRMLRFYTQFLLLPLSKTHKPTETAKLGREESFVCCLNLCRAFSFLASVPGSDGE